MIQVIDANSCTKGLLDAPINTMLLTSHIILSSSNIYCINKLCCWVGSILFVFKVFPTLRYWCYINCCVPVALLVLYKLLCWFQVPCYSCCSWTVYLSRGVVAVWCKVPVCCAVLYLRELSTLLSVNQGQCLQSI